MLFALLVLICIAGAAAIAVLLRDSYTFTKVQEYITILQTNGEDSSEEYAFRERASETISDLCHLIRASRDDAKFDKVNNQHFDNMLEKVVKSKSKRKGKSPRGKK